MKGIIPQTLTRLHAKNFAPNMEHQILEEENERSYLEWCRKEESLSPAGIPSRFLVADKTERWLRKITGIIP